MATPLSSCTWDVSPTVRADGCNVIVSLLITAYSVPMKTCQHFGSSNIQNMSYYYDSHVTDCDSFIQPYVRCEVGTAQYVCVLFAFNMQSLCTRVMPRNCVTLISAYVKRIPCDSETFRMG